MTIIYYVLDANNGEPCICITPKDYWDQNHCMSDGHDKRLFNFMENVTDSEICTNMFALNDIADIWSIITKAREAGYDFQTNAEFTTFMNGSR